VGEENETQYQARVGKWTMMATRDLETSFFWGQLIVASTSKAPLSHCMNKLMAGGLGRSKLLVMLDSFTGEIGREFSALAHDPSQWRLLLDLVTAKRLDENEWVSRAVLVMLELASEFDRRIASYVHSFPLRIFGLVLSPHDRACENRACIADDLLNLHAGGAASGRTTDGLPDGFTLKFVALFQGLIEQTRATGFLDPELHAFHTSLSERVPLDTQRIEGMNSMVKRCVKLAPNIGLPLLSSRIQIKKACHHLLQTKADRSELVQLAVHHHEEARAGSAT